MAPIPIKKQTTDIGAVKNCYKVAKEGGTIAIAPEGNRTYSGKTLYMSPTIASLSKKIKLPIATMLIEGFSKQKTYSIINASGNSMAPTIENGDKLIVEHWNGTQIQDNKIYVFCYNNEFFVKRLSKNLDEIIIKSDNPEYRIRTIDRNSTNEVIIVGKIVGVIKTLG